MPCKNAVRCFRPDSYYHVYNRGVEKRLIFLDERDYQKFCYCLMPNHFHLLIKQESINGATKLLHRLTSAYTTYFNDRYGRVGTLMQGRFRAVAIESELQLIHVGNYIHQNPVHAGMIEEPTEYSWSSCHELAVTAAMPPVCRHELAISSSLPCSGLSQDGMLANFGGPSPSFAVPDLYLDSDDSS